MTQTKSDAKLQRVKSNIKNLTGVGLENWVLRREYKHNAITKSDASNQDLKNGLILSHEKSEVDIFVGKGEAQKYFNIGVSKNKPRLDANKIK